MRLLMLFGASLVVLVASTVARAPDAQTRRMTITAERYDFFPSQITVPVGTVLELDLQSEDTAHGFRIAGSGVNVTIPKRGGGRAQVMFRAERAGEFVYECSRMCGAGHNFMRGRIVVTEEKSR
jgi:cytochrome c oxidase subunit 2